MRNIRLTYVSVAMVFSSIISTMEGHEIGNSPLIVEGRVWEYVSDTYLPPTYKISRMRFEGTDILDGRTYHRLTYCDSIYSWSHGENGVIFPNQAVPESCYLLRDEEGKVYLRYSKETLGEYGESIPGLKAPEEGKDLLIYDFSLRKGDVMRGITNHGSGSFSYMDYMVMDDWIEDVNGKQTLFQSLRPFTSEDDIDNYDEDRWNGIVVAEGIGNVNMGDMVYFPTSEQVVGGPFTSLNRVYAPDGGVVYCYMDIDNRATGSSTIVMDNISITYSHKSIMAQGNGMIKVLIYDIDGSLLSALEGEDSLKIDVSLYVPGVYVAVAEADGMAVGRRKFVVR